MPKNQNRTMSDIRPPKPESVPMAPPVPAKTTPAPRPSTRPAQPQPVQSRPSPVAPPSQAQANVQQASPAPKRRRWVVILIVLISIGLLGAVAFYLATYGLST